MKLYTNTLPVEDGYSSGDKPLDVIPVGSTFGLICVNGGGFVLKTPKNAINKSVHIMPEIFKAAFKEVELGE